METAKNERLAYLRALDATNQCELAFKLSATINGTILCEQVKAVRQITDTVGSMLQHIQNKLNKILKTKLDETVPEQGGEIVEIPVWLEDTAEKIEGNVVLKELIEPEKVYEFYIVGQKFTVVVNAPLVQLIVLPVIIYANSVIQPIKYKMLYTRREDTDFVWYKSVDRKTWDVIGYKFILKTKESHINHYLKLRCVPRSKHSCGPAYEVISENTVIAMPALPTCPFEQRHQYTPTKLTDKQFRIVSYNTLSYRYSETNSQFPYCPNEYLAIDYRKLLLLKEISGYNADVICLQEVDNKEYLYFFQAKFKKLGYESIFHKKGNKIPEGLSCVYNAKKFKAIYSKQLVFSEELKQNAIFKNIKQSIAYGPDIEDVFLKLHTSLQVTVLQSKILNQRLIVANTHLYYHPDARNIRVIQVAMATTFLEVLKRKLQKESKGKVSVVFCGDFNSIPSSEVYHYMTKRKLENEHKRDLKVIDNIENFTHPFHFASACGTPEFTNFTADFKGCLDYIFYDKRNIKLLQFVPFIDESILSQHTALPNVVFPSDHLALVADLRFI